MREVHYSGRPSVLAKNAERRQTEQFRARMAVAAAVKRGDLVRPASCSACGRKGRIEGHHADYARALEVVWLCIRCHASLHAHSENPHMRVTIDGQP